MDFIEQANEWSKLEAIQAKTMIAIGLIFIVILLGIIKSEVPFVQGALIPVSLIVVLLVGYGSYILYSRPAHVQKSIALYKESPAEGIIKETEKHTNDNKAGKTLLKIYPILALISITLLIFVSSQYYKGLSIGFTFLFLITYIMDHGFVRRSDDFLEFLSKLT